MEAPKPHSNFVRGFFFWTGIISTVAYRVIVILNNYNPIWVQIAWYAGTIGFIIYFIHRYQISETRAKLIQANQLDSKIDGLAQLSGEDREAMRYIFKTLRSTKEKWNYIFIFFASAAALVWGIYLDFIA